MVVFYDYSLSFGNGAAFERFRKRLFKGSRKGYGLLHLWQIGSHFKNLLSKSKSTNGSTGSTRVFRKRSTTAILSTADSDTLPYILNSLYFTTWISPFKFSKSSFNYKSTVSTESSGSDTHLNVKFRSGIWLGHDGRKIQLRRRGFMGR